jgi:serine/threonine protein kinase
MATRLSLQEFLRNLTDSGLIPKEELDAALKGAAEPPADGERLAERLVASGRLTSFQATAVRERQFEQLVIGNYDVLDRLGAGGMGTVYKARHRRMKRVVAIKVLSRSVGQDEQFVQRFQREVEAVARMSHPNIVMAHDAGEADVGHFLVMEFVNGRDLASEVDERGPLPVPEALDCLLQAARALDYAHGQGVIHRDIKPANLLRDVHGVVKAADLGLARFRDPLGQTVAARSALTQAGAIMGTVDYMSPEQALGLTDIDHRTDIYSLGGTLHYLLTARPPYEGPTIMAILLKHREGAIPSLGAQRADVPAAVDRVFQRMMAKKPQERFASMAEVVRALEALAQALRSPRGPSETVSLMPAAPATDQTLDLPPPPRPAPSAATILLVEPSRTQSVIIRKYLDEIGFHDVSVLSSGQKALEAARAAPPAAVVSAMHLPDMTGVQLARAVRAEPAIASSGFVLITSEADAAETKGLSKLGHVVALSKPFRPDQLAQALTAALGAGPTPPEAPGDLRALVVDDSGAARSHIRGVLAGLGLHRIVEAGDGAAAVAALEEAKFDLVVTDYNMPRLDGRGLLDFIRHRSTNPSVPVIVVTTETDPAKLEAVRRLGVTAVCDKSFRPEVVRDLLKGLGRADG